MKYKQITRAERVVISNMMELIFSYTEIANHLNRNKGSISREIKRNSNIDPESNLLVYDPDYAHKKKKRIRVTVNKQQIKL
jgi:IS30 family transposase